MTTIVENGNGSSNIFNIDTPSMSIDYDNTTMMMDTNNSIYSNSQQIALVLTSAISGSLSLLGSILIVRIIFQDFRNKMSHVYHRILFAMSVIDIINSFNGMFGFLAVPRGYFWGSIGTTFSCNVSGFLFEFGTAVGMYNLGLSLYYFLSLRANKNQRFIAMYVEPVLHGCCLGIPLAMGLWAWVLEALNPLRSVGGWCYIYKFPPLCTSAETATSLSISCTRGGKSWKLLGFVSILAKGVPVWIGIIVLMTLIWSHVRAQEMAVERYRSSSVRRSLNNVNNDNTHNNNSNHYNKLTTTRQAFEQAMLYIFAYLLTYVFSLINLFIPTDASQTVQFAIAFMVKLTLPLQGFFNLFIYIRPRYHSLKRDSRTDESLTSYEILKIILIRGSASDNNNNGRNNNTVSHRTLSSNSRYFRGVKNSFRYITSSIASLGSSTQNDHRGSMDSSSRQFENNSSYNNNSRRHSLGSTSNRERRNSIDSLSHRSDNQRRHSLGSTQQCRRRSSAGGISVESIGRILEDIYDDDDDDEGSMGDDLEALSINYNNYGDNNNNNNNNNNKERSSIITVKNNNHTNDDFCYNIDHLEYSDNQDKITNIYQDKGDRYYFDDSNNSTKMTDDITDNLYDDSLSKLETIYDDETNPSDNKDCDGEDDGHCNNSKSKLIL